MPSKEISKELLIALSAERFWQSGVVVHKQHTQSMNGQWLPASTMLGMLAIELYFKLLEQIEKGSFSHGHDFEKLYESLSSESQEAIQVKFEELVKRDSNIQRMAAYFKKELRKEIKLDFKNQLNEMKDAFIQQRYHFEGNAKSSLTINQLRQAIVARINELSDVLEEVVNVWNNSQPEIVKG